MCESAIAIVSGAVQEKLDHQHLKVGSYSLGSVWLSVIVWISRGVFSPSTMAGVLLSQLSGRMCQHQRDFAEARQPLDQGGQKPAQRIHRSRCSPSHLSALC